MFWCGTVRSDQDWRGAAVKAGRGKLRIGAARRFRFGEAGFGVVRRLGFVTVR